MTLANAEVPSDPEALHRFALACKAELMSTTAELNAAKLALQYTTLEIEKLKFQLAKLRRMQFGRSSERLTRQIEQLELQIEELEAEQAGREADPEPEDGEPQPKRNRPRRKPLPDHLPRQEVVHQPQNDAACTCPCCGGGMAKLGEDVTEVLDYVPGHFQVIRHVRPKYACEKCDTITQAAAPAMPTPRGRATPATLAHVLVSKYCDHLPLYRQCEIYAREGVELDRSTLSSWVGQATWLLDPVVASIREHVFEATKIHGDDTTVPVLEPGLGRTKTGRLWVYVRDDRPSCGVEPPAAAYFYSPDRRAEHPAEHLAEFTGYLQADGYSGFDTLYNPGRNPGPIVEVACWAHCRRKIYDAWETTKSPTARQALDQIAELYRIEDKARFAPPEERVQHRSQTAAVLNTFFDSIGKTLPKLSAKSPLADAFRYIINRREALTRFVADGTLEADNNTAENSIRPLVVGRKNYLFAGSDRGGHSAAAMYTIFQTCRLNNVEPEGYLRRIIQNIADGHPINRIRELLPWARPPDRREV